MADSFHVDQLEADIAEVTERITDLTDDDLALIDDCADDLKTALRREQIRRRQEGTDRG